MFGLSKNEKVVKALKENDLATLQRLIALDENGISANAFTSKANRYRLLHSAAAANNREAVKLLLNLGANTEVRSVGEKTPDEMTTDPDIAEWIRQRRFLEFIPFREESALKILSDNPSWDLDKITSQNGRTALHIAAYWDRLDVINTVLDRGANINALDADGETPLHRAAWHECHDTIQLLLERGADKWIISKSGKSAEQIARQQKTKNAFSYSELKEFLEVCAKHGQKKSQPSEPSTIHAPSDEIILTRPLAGRVLTEVFNFKTQEYARLITATEKGPVEHAEYEMFPDVKNRARLKEAFGIYREKGGTADETILHAIVEPRIKKPFPDTGP